MKMVSVKNIILGQFKNDKFLRYDLAIKYLFIKKYYKKNKPEKFQYKLYDLLYLTKKSKKRPNGVSAEHIRREYDKFMPLINSFEEKGYDSSYPLFMNDKYFMCGGSHRLILSVWFDIKKVPVIFLDHCEGKKRRYSRRWMKSYGFKKYISLLDDTRDIILKKVGI